MKFSYGEQVKDKTGWPKLLGYILVIIVVFSAIGWFGVSRWYSSNLKPVDETSQLSQTFVVEPGTSVRSIADRLEEQGLIKNANVFSWYVDRSDQWSDLQAGTYSLSTGMNVETIVEKLATGDIDTSLVTIFPGRRLDEISDDLVEAGYSESEVESAMITDYDNAILESRPAGATLEGYIFPDTYQVTDNTSLQDLFSIAFDELDERLTLDHRQAIKKRGLTLHEAITLASIIEKESSDPATQKKIAGVFFNRLDRGMPLGADATFRYASAIAGVEPTVDIDSPYNTRIVTGLPPGPIANFNFPALDAVANPVVTDDLYFVSGDDGNTYFSETLSEHEEKVDRYCDENCRIAQ